MVAAHRVAARTGADPSGVRLVVATRGGRQAADITGDHPAAPVARMSAVRRVPFARPAGDIPVSGTLPGGFGRREGVALQAGHRRPDGAGLPVPCVHPIGGLHPVGFARRAGDGEGPLVGAGDGVRHPPGVGVGAPDGAGVGASVGASVGAGPRRLRGAGPSRPPRLWWMPTRRRRPSSSASPKPSRRPSQPPSHSTGTTAPSRQGITPMSSAARCHG